MFNLKKSLILISLFLVLALSLSTVSASDIDDNSLISADLQVNEVDTDVSNVQYGNDFYNIQSIIDCAEEGSTVDLDNITYYGDGEPIYVNKSLKIRGSDNTILNAQENSHIFEINADNVILENLKLTNGVNEEYSGAIIWLGNSGSLVDCEFYDNFGDLGAILWNGADATIENSIFHDNIGISSGAIVANDITIYNSVFYSNVAGIPVDENEEYDENLNAGGFGGAITSVGNLNCNNCSFIENYAFGYDERGFGGAICAIGNLSLYDCEFESNFAQIMGGAIFVSDYRNDFDNFYPSDLLISNCYFNTNAVGFEDYGSIGGGAIFLSNTGSALISDSIFENNIGILNTDEYGFIIGGPNGGAIYASSSFNCINSNFIGCSAYNGGVIYAELEKGSVNIDRCNFDSNSVENSGGAIYCKGYLNINLSNFTSNKGLWSGGAIYCIGTLVSNSSYYKNNNIDNNGAYGGAIYNKGKLTCSNSTFIANNAPVGGAIHNIYYKKTIPSIESLTSKDLSNITRSSFYNNTAERGGAVSICTFGELSYCIFDGNAALGKDFVYSTDYYFTYNYNYWGVNFNSYENFIKSGKIYKINYDEYDNFYSAFYYWRLCPSIWYNNPNFTSDCKISQFSLKFYNLKETYAEGSCYFALINGNFYEDIKEYQKITIEAYKSGKLVKSKVYYGNVFCLPFNLPVGTYTLKAYYEGKSITKTYIVTKAKGTLTATKSFTTTYKSDKKISIKLVNYKSRPLNPVSSQKVSVIVYKSGKKYKTYYVTTNSKGYAYFNTSNLKKGTYTVYISCSNSNIAATKIKRTIKVNKMKATITTKAVSVTYGSSSYLTINLVNAATKAPLGSKKLTVTLYKSGKKYKTYYVTTNSKGVAKLSTKSLPVAKYTASISYSTSTIVATKVKTTVTVNKIKATITAKSITVHYNSTNYLTINLVNAATKAPLGSKKLTVTLYKSGKKYKTYYVTTNSKGVAKLSTKSLPVAKYTASISYSTSTIVATTVKTNVNVVKIMNVTITSPEFTKGSCNNGTIISISVKDPNNNPISNLNLKINLIIGYRFFDEDMNYHGSENRYNNFTVLTDNNGLFKLTPEIINSNPPVDINPEYFSIAQNVRINIIIKENKYQGEFTGDLLLTH